MDEPTKTDDGSLSFLNIPRDEGNRSFNCDETTQSKLVNTTFWVTDFIEDVPTRFSKQKGTKGQTLVKIKPERDSKERLHRAFREIRRYMEERLRLTVKDNWQVFPIAESRYDRHGRALDFVGYRFYRRQKLLRKSIKRNLCRKAARLMGKGLSAKALRQALAPWLGWAGHSDSRHLLKTILKPEYHAGIL